MNHSSYLKSILNILSLVMHRYRTKKKQNGIFLRNIFCTKNFSEKPINGFVQLYNSEKIQNQFQAKLSVSFKYYRLSSKADSAV